MMKQLNDTAIDLFSGRFAALCQPAKAGIAVITGANLRNVNVKSVLLGAIRNAVRLLGLLVAFGIFGVQAQADAQNSISSLSVNTGTGTTVINVQLTQPLKNLPAGFTINAPPRIAFDFPDTTNGLGKSVQDFNEGDLRSAHP